MKPHEVTSGLGLIMALAYTPSPGPKHGTFTDVDPAVDARPSLNLPRAFRSCLSIGCDKEASDHASLSEGVVDPSDLHEKVSLTVTEGHV